MIKSDQTENMWFIEVQNKQKLMATVTLATHIAIQTHINVTVGKAR